MNLLAILLFLAAQQQLHQTIIVTASELPETIESTPAAVAVITRNDIDAREARDVADVLREVPGLQLARSGSAGKATSLFTRGAASTQTLVLWNGIELNNPYFSGYDWGRFSTAGVEQIEVVRGPFSALYGSEAMAGVVNVLTAPQTSGVRAEVQGGGRGLRNGLIQGAYAGGGVEVSGTAELRRDNGFHPNDDFSQDTYYVAGRWTLSPSSSLGLTARATSYDLGIPFNTGANGSTLVPSPNRRQDGHEWEIALPMSYRWFNLTLSQNKRTDNFNDPEDPFTTSTRTDSTSRRGRLTGHFGTFVAGAEYERVVVTDVTNFGPNFEDQHRTDRALFVEDRLAHAFGSSRLELSLGLRNDHFDVFGSQTSPRVAAAWIHGSQKYRVAYGEGFRAPSLGELYYPFFGNPELKAEQNRSFEAGFDTAIAKSGLINITYFRAKYRDLITFDPTTFVSENIGKVFTDGIEAGAQFPIAREFNAGISYTWLHRADDESTGQRLARRPKSSGSLFAGWHHGDFAASVVVLSSGERFDAQPVLPFARVTDPAYTTLDFNVQWHVRSVTPFLKVENAADAHYEEVAGYASPRRRAIVGVRWAMDLR